MSHVTIKEWYARVNAAWPEYVPPLTQEEARIAVPRLWRSAMSYFGNLKQHRRELFRPRRVRFTSGNRRPFSLRRQSFVVNAGAGWRRVVHSLSHWAFWIVPTEGGDRVHPHDPQHARLELHLIKQVLRRGWLAGKLKPTPKLQPSPEQLRTAEREKRRASVERRIREWGRWLKRA